ncbi:hypothetical protein Tco_0833368 [Tanacetum coccineum]
MITMDQRSSIRTSFVEIQPCQFKTDDTWILDPEMCMLHSRWRLKGQGTRRQSIGKMVIKLKWLWKNKKDEDQTVIFFPGGKKQRRLVAKGYAQEEARRGYVDPDHPKKSTLLRKSAMNGLKHAPEPDRCSCPDALILGKSTSGWEYSSLVITCAQDNVDEDHNFRLWLSTTNKIHLFATISQT